MMPTWGWIIVLYFFGAVSTARPLTLWAETDKQQRDDRCPDCKDKVRWCTACDNRNEDLRFMIALGIIFWPIPAIYMLSKKVLFPRGIVTAYQKQKRLEAQNKKRADALKDQEDTLRKFCEAEGIPWVPVHNKPEA